MIDLPLILKKLKYPELQIINQTDCTYLTIIRNEHAVNLHDKRLIHLMTAKEYDTSAKAPLDGALFLIGYPQRDCLPSDTVVFPENTDPDVLLSQIQEIFSEYRRFSDYRMKLEALATNATDISDIFQLFATYFNNPVVFGDSGGNIIYMENIRDDFHDWDEAIQYWITLGYTPYEYSKANGNIEMTSMWQNSPVPVLFNQKFASQYPRLSYRTCKYNHVYNNYFCIAQVYEPYKCFDEDVLILTADLVSSKYSRNAFLEIENPREKAFKLLAQQNTPHTESNEDRLIRCHIPVCSESKVILLDFPKTTLTENNQKSLTQKIGYTKNMLNHLQPPILNYQEEDKLVLLLQANTPEGLNTMEQKLISILEKDITIACSNSYKSIWNTHEMYKRAALALQTGNALFPEEQIYHFQDLYFECLVWTLHQNNTLSSFITDGLLELIQYDQQKHTEFAVTLYEYLLCDKNIATLSQKLHIHRNTSLYRLEKANEWLKLDFNNYEDTSQLLISYKALEILRKLKVPKDETDS